MVEEAVYFNGKDSPDMGIPKMIRGALLNSGEVGSLGLHRTPL